MPNPTGHTDSIKNSQFKAAWQSGPTRTIRVPISLADATLEYARQLDQGIEPRDTSEISNSETDIATIEARDTAIESSNQVATKASEPRDTSNLQAELEDSKAKNQTWREAFKELEGERDALEWEAGVHRAANQRLRAELEAAKNAPVEIHLPEAADLLNRLKAKRKKVGASLAEIQAILEMIEASQDDTSQEN